MSFAGEHVVSVEKTGSSRTCAMCWSCLARPQPNVNLLRESPLGGGRPGGGLPWAVLRWGSVVSAGFGISALTVNGACENGLLPPMVNSARESMTQTLLVVDCWVWASG